MVNIFWSYQYHICETYTCADLLKILYDYILHDSNLYVLYVVVKFAFSYWFVRYTLYTMAS